MHDREVYRQVAELHASGIDQGFLATLGRPFLALMYEAIDRSPGSVLLVEKRDGRVVGFISGAVGMGPVYRRMLRRPFALAMALLPSLFRPSRLRRILEILRYRPDNDGTVELPEAELLSLAVTPGARGTGVSEKLYRGLEARFAQMGVRRFCITVGDQLAPAHRFYRKMGALPASRVEVHRGQGSVVYVHALEGR